MYKRGHSLVVLYWRLILFSSRWTGRSIGEFMILISAINNLKVRLKLSRQWACRPIVSTTPRINYRESWSVRIVNLVFIECGHSSSSDQRRARASRFVVPYACFTKGRDDQECHTGPVLPSESPCSSTYSTQTQQVWVPTVYFSLVLGGTIVSGDTGF